VTRLPVPFPAANQVKQARPDAAEARVIAGGVAGAVAPGGQLTSLQRLMIDALTESMTDFVVAASVVPRLGPEEFARAMADRNEGFRTRMVQFMLLGALVLNPVPIEVVERVEQYAHELGIRHDMLRVAHRLAKGSYGLACVDFERSGYTSTWDAARSDVLHTSSDVPEPWIQSVHDVELAHRWAALRDLHANTLGAQVANFYAARGFTFPGEPGSAPPLLAQHDWVHVLAEYGSTVESEIEVFAFIARANDDPRAFSLLAQIIGLFETGHVATGLGIFEYDRGHLSHEGMAVRLADAMRRGALSATANHSIDFFTVDWFEHAGADVDEVRVRLGIVPKAERAVALGSVTPWERGGITPFQYEAGGQRARDEGRAYEAFGATPG
jgi:hypothetical protein